MITRKIISLCRSKYNRLCSSLTQPDIDLGYYCDVNNSSEVKQNISLRKGIGNIDRVLDIYNQLKVIDVANDLHESLKRELYQELSKLPNKTHPTVQGYKDEPILVHELNKKRDFGTYTPLEFSEITRLMNLMRTDKLGQTCGHKSYYFLGELAELEEALIKYAVSYLIKENFKLVSVPDILPKNVLEGCGMAINSDRMQIYSLDPIHHGQDLYLSGTAEMSLAGLLMNSVHSSTDLPLKLAAVSRCFRAETSSIIEERGVYRARDLCDSEHVDEEMSHVRKVLKLNGYRVSTQQPRRKPRGKHPDVSRQPAFMPYVKRIKIGTVLQRVHQFTKVEMFAVSSPQESEGMLEYIRSVQEQMFLPLGFNMKVLDMPPHELGAPAYRKYDIESWMPGRDNYGEVSSCSNCTDYQSRRLNIKYNDGNKTNYVHTLNGTACAVPRMLITLLETHQDPKGKIYIPDVLQSYMRGKKYIKKNSAIPDLKLMKKMK